MKLSTSALLAASLLAPIPSAAEFGPGAARAFSRSQKGGLNIDVGSKLDRLEARAKAAAKRWRKGIKAKAAVLRAKKAEVRRKLDETYRRAKARLR